MVPRPPSTNIARAWPLASSLALACVSSQPHTPQPAVPHPPSDACSSWQCVPTLDSASSRTPAAGSHTSTSWRRGA
eukprot:353404-Chlamydomonas_euryale.AAC.12